PSRRRQRLEKPWMVMVSTAAAVDGTEMVRVVSAVEGGGPYRSGYGESFWVRQKNFSAAVVVVAGGGCQNMGEG
nr:hypothetical protein [Tanacetum cinerariifolium]